MRNKTKRRDMRDSLSAPLAGALRASPDRNREKTWERRNLRTLAEAVHVVRPLPSRKTPNLEERHVF
jgi:hypothetical protein